MSILHELTPIAPAVIQSELQPLKPNCWAAVEYTSTLESKVTWQVDELYGMGSLLGQLSFLVDHPDMLLEAVYTRDWLIIVHHGGPEYTLWRL